MDRAAFVCRQYIGLTPHPDSPWVSTQGEGGRQSEREKEGGREVRRNCWGCVRGGKGVCFSAGKICLFQGQGDIAKSPRTIVFVRKLDLFLDL